MLITVHVKPRARKTSVEWIDDETAKIAVTAAAEKGKANEEVLRVLADELGVPKTSLSIKRGLTTRMKQIEVP